MNFRKVHPYVNWQVTHKLFKQFFGYCKGCWQARFNREAKILHITLLIYLDFVIVKKSIFIWKIKRKYIFIQIMCGRVLFLIFPRKVILKMSIFSSIKVLVYTLRGNGEINNGFLEIDTIALEDIAIQK